MRTDVELKAEASIREFGDFIVTAFEGEIPIAEGRLAYVEPNKGTYTLTIEDKPQTYSDRTFNFTPNTRFEKHKIDRWD